MISIRITGLDEAKLTVGSWGPKAQAAIRQTVTAQGLALVRRVKEQKLSGQVLRTRSGTLRRSITSSVSETAGGVTATVGTNVVYAAIHEFGGVIRIPEIRPVTAKALHWGNVFSMRARAHDVIMPERSFLRSALAEQAPEARAALVASLTEALK